MKMIRLRFNWYALLNKCVSLLYFKVKLQKSKVLSRSAADPVLFNETLRTVACVPFLQSDEKIKIASYIPKKDINDEKDIEFVTKRFLVLANGTESSLECANASLFLIKKTHEHPEHQLALLNVAAKCCQTVSLIPIFEKDCDKTVFNILTNDDRDMELGIAALEVVKTYTDPSYEQIKEDYKARFDF